VAQATDWSVVKLKQAAKPFFHPALVYRQVFSALYGTNELLSSFDSINITRPGTDASGGWLHVDQVGGEDARLLTECAKRQHGLKGCPVSPGEYTNLRTDQRSVY
jgi:hypothetical protein